MDAFIKVLRLSSALVFVTPNGSLKVYCAGFVGCVFKMLFKVGPSSPALSFFPRESTRELDTNGEQITNYKAVNQRNKKIFFDCFMVVTFKSTKKK